MTETAPEAVSAGPRQQWVAFIGGSWLWHGDDKADPRTRAAHQLGDMTGPFPTWSAACEYLLGSWPLAMREEGDPELTPEETRSYRESFEDLIRPLDPPEAWGHAPLTTEREVTEAIEEVSEAAETASVGHGLLKVEIEHFWETHQVT
jgi:hypothetical protein